MKYTFKEFLSDVKSDLTRYKEPFLKSVLFIPGYKYTFHHRLCYYFYCHKLFFILFVIHWLYMKHLTYLYGIQTAWNKRLPRDFVIAHFGGITFFPRECGEGIYLLQGVTVGGALVGVEQRHPKIGNNVVFGANSIVVGDIEIGDDVVIAAGAVVVKDVPAGCVVGGVPARIIKQA